MRLETIHPKELGPADIGRWRAHQRADADLHSPYLTPDWAQLIGSVRDDARVCVVEDGAGFLGVQRVSRFAAMGLGAPIADYQGLVGEPGLMLDDAELCRALQVGRIDLAHVPPGRLPRSAGAEGSWIAECAGGRDLYEAAIKQRRAEFARQTDKKLRKIQREMGVEFRADTQDRAAFETLIAWKNEQLERTGQPHIWAAPWVRTALDACFETRDPRFGGLLFSMTAGDRLAAAVFCLRSESVLHLWLLGHDSAFDACSPGVLLSRWIIGWAGDNGFSEVDFGGGEYQYKRQLSTKQRMLDRGVIAGVSWSGAVRRAEHAVRARVERLPHARLAALPGKAMRRLDLVRALG